MSDIPILEPNDAYRLWSEGYPPWAHNPLMFVEERAMLGLLPSNLVAHSVLDAGCGAGRYLFHAARRGARQLVGVDSSREMLERARRESAPGTLALGRLAALPVRDEWADVVICGLTIGHVSLFSRALTELSRVTRRGGRILCSDLHPVGEKFGWQRTFRSNGKQYAVRHTYRSLSDWQTACAVLNLTITRWLEPRLTAFDIPPGARFDRAALQVPVALVLEIQKGSER